MHAARPFFEGLHSIRVDNEGMVGWRGEQMATSVSPPSPAPIACLTHLTSSKRIELLLSKTIQSATDPRRRHDIVREVGLHSLVGFASSYM